jgi:membrane protease YdiL (CAAX protease family)
MSGLPPLREVDRVAAIMDAKHPLIIFFTLAYAWAWLVFIPMVIFHAPLPWIVVATFGPTVAALVTHRITTGSYRAFRIYTTWPRTLGAMAVGVALIILVYVVLPGIITADPRKLHWSILISTAVYNYSTLLGGPLGEEPGWRGYALPRLENAFGPVRGSLLLGLLWAGWHLPLFFYSGWTTSPLWIYVVLVTGLSFILTYAANLAGYGVVVPIAMHATFNTVSRFLNGLFASTQSHERIPVGLVMALSGLAMAVVLILVTRGQLAHRRDSLLIARVETPSLP